MSYADFVIIYINNEELDKNKRKKRVVADTCREVLFAEVPRSSLALLYFVNQILSFGFPRLQWPASPLMHIRRIRP